MHKDRHTISGYAFLIGGGAVVLVIEMTGHYFTLDD